MHLSDGILDGSVCLAGYAASAALIAYSARKIDNEDVPKISVVTAAFFVASLIHIKLGPSSMHLVLNGLVGILLGAAAVPSIFIGLLLQAVVFGHGGITTLGVNTIIMGTPALLSWFIFRIGRKRQKSTLLFFSFVAGAAAIAGAALLTALFLMTAGKEFFAIARIVLLANIPIMLIEATITLFVVSFLLKVKPQLLD